MNVQQIVEAALSRRASLVEDGGLTAYRLLHGMADGVPGVVMERLADVLIVQVHEGHVQASVSDVGRLATAFMERMGLRAAYRKCFVPDRARASAEVQAMHLDPVPWLGEPAESRVMVEEHGLRFVVRPYDGFSVGLFLEHRDNRRRVRELAAGRRVLNLFAYTCGFSVAVAGGAASVASVDLHKRYLEWGKENFAANGLDLAAHMFYCSDVFDFYHRARRQGLQYDLIVLDPPSFARMRRPKRSFVLGEQLDPLCAGAVGLLAPGGQILLATNHRQIPAERLEAALHLAAGGRTCRILDRPALPVDFAGDPDYARTVIAEFG